MPPRGERAVLGASEPLRLEAGKMRRGALPRQGKPRELQQQRKSEAWEVGIQGAPRFRA